MLCLAQNPFETVIIGRLYQKTDFEIGFGHWEVHQPETRENAGFLYF